MILSCQIISNERERERPPRQRTTTITPCSYVQTNDGFALIHALRERERERVEVEIQCLIRAFFFTYTLIHGLREREDKAREKKKIEDGREREREIEAELQF